MDDEPLILEIDIAGDMQAMRVLKQMADEMRSMQRPLDDAIAKVAQLNNQMQNAASAGAHRMASVVKNLAGSGGSGGGGVGDMVKGLTGGAGGMGNLLKGGAGGFGDILSGAAARFAGAIDPVTALLMVASVAVKQMGEAAREAADDLRGFRESMFTSGGTARESSQLQGIGNLTGADAVAMSRSLADKLASDGQASAFGQNAGVHDYGTFDRTDKASNLLKVADYIRNLKSDEEAIREARVLGVEPLLKLRDVSEGVYQDFKRSEEMAASIRTPQDIQNASNMNAEMQRFNMEADTLGTRIKESLIPGITDLYSLGANALHAINEEGTKLGKWWQALMGVPDDRKNGQLAHDDTQKKHTQAMQEHAQALRSGTFGGGQRARGALPSAWGGSNAHNWDSETRKLGAL